MAVERIRLAIDAARRLGHGAAAGLIACAHGEEGARAQRLLPLPASPRHTRGMLPITHEAPAQVAAGVVEHYVFHTLLALLLRSIRVENKLRLMQMESALRHLEQSGDELHRHRNRLRQAEIIEEIEIMAGGIEESAADSSWKY
jgi:F-type H+-transporting ATPase subunit gamma